MPMAQSGGGRAAAHPAVGPAVAAHSRYRWLRQRPEQFRFYQPLSTYLLPSPSSSKWAKLSPNSLILPFWQSCLPFRARSRFISLSLFSPHLSPFGTPLLESCIACCTLKVRGLMTLCGLCFVDWVSWFWGKACLAYLRRAQGHVHLYGIDI